MSNYDVSIVPCDSYDAARVEAALRAALAPIDALAFVRPGMTVGLKVNLVTAMKPDAAATVHPSVVCALVRLLKERGARAVIGDSPGGLYAAPYLKVVYDVCGMRQAEAFGAKLNDDFSQVEVSCPQAVQARQFSYTAWLQKVDAIIDLCKLKTHGMMGLSCAVKNFFGTIPGTKKPEYHYRYPRAEDFADMLVDLYEYSKPRLCVCDAVIGKIADFAAARILTPFPKLASGCVGCGKCAKVCPAKAITMKSGKPKIDRRVCIHCFCCQEFCPKGAMQVGRHALMKLLGR